MDAVVPLLDSEDSVLELLKHLLGLTDLFFCYYKLCDLESHPPESHDIVDTQLCSLPGQEPQNRPTVLLDDGVRVLFKCFISPGLLKPVLVVAVHDVDQFALFSFDLLLDNGARLVSRDRNTVHISGFMEDYVVLVKLADDI